MTTEPFSDEAKSTLQNLMPNIDFVVMDDSLKRYQCQCCGQVALLHHIAECHHIFCECCLERILHKRCPVEQCSNDTINKLTHDDALEQEVLHLGMYCQFRKHGCEDIFPLLNYFLHQKTCQYLTDGLLSTNWQKVKDFLPTTSVEMKIAHLDNTLKDVLSRLNAIEESIQVIKEKEKTYNEAFIVLKEIRASLKDQDNKHTSQIQTQVNEDVMSNSLSLELPGGNSGTFASDGDVAIELKSTINQLQESISTIMKDLTLMKSNFDEYSAKSLPQAPFITEKQFLGLVEDMVNMKTTINGLHETVSDLGNRVNWLEERQKISNLEDADVVEDSHEDTQEHLEICKLENKLEGLETRLKDLEQGNENFICEQKQIRNCAEVKLKAGVPMHLQADNEVKRGCSKCDHQGEDCSTFTWELIDFTEILAKFKNNIVQEIESPIFLTKEGYEIKAKLVLYKDFLSIYLAFVGGSGTSKSAYFHKRTFIVVDQKLTGHENRDLVRSWEPAFGTKNMEKWMKEFYGSLHFITWTLLEESDCYVINDKIIIKIVIEPLTMLYRTFSSNDGMLFWKVEDYFMHKKRESNGLTQGLKSRYFYTSPKGYRVQMELCFTGYGEENREHLSVFIWFRRGEFDDFLSKRFAHKTTIWILDQSDSEDKVHLRKTAVLPRIQNTIFSKFALQSTIEDAKYLKNDVLLIKVIVEPIDEKEESENDNSKTEYLFPKSGLLAN